MKRAALMIAAVIMPPLVVASTPARSSGPRTVWDSVYTMTQAARGESTYAKTCARCHGAAMSGGDESPPLVGGAFLGNWNGVALSELHTRIRTTMPSDTVGIYSAQLVADVMAHLLKANGFPAGQVELSANTDSLRDIMIRTSHP